MDSCICHQSPWMREKALDYQKNLLLSYNDRVGDDDVFLPLECPETESMLRNMIRKLPVRVLKDLAENRSYGFQLDLEYDPPHTMLAALWNRPELRKKIKSILPDLFSLVKASNCPAERGCDFFRERVLELQETLKLSNREVDLLMIVVLMIDEILCDPRNVRRIGNSASQKIFMMALCLNTSESDILNSIRPNKALRKYNCLDEDLDLTREIGDFLSGMTDEPLAHNYYTKDSEESLPWSDFADLTEIHGDILTRMLKKSGSPVNILFYGAPGTGKTSFARTLATKVKKKAFRISQSSGDKGCRTNSSAEFRFGALMLCDAQVDPSTSLIVVDEADEMLRGRGADGLFDMFGSRSSPAGDKGILNTVLDNMKTSTIWISNTPAQALDESSRRRFDYSICFAPLNSEQRKRIWKNNIRRLRIGCLFTGKQLDRFSTLYPVSAGGIAQTLDNLAELRPRKQEVPQLIEKLMRPHCELMGIRLADDSLLPAKDYSIEGLNIRGNISLKRIVNAVRKFQLASDLDIDRPRMSLLLSGAPGTGKTEFVKYLGQELDTKINIKTGSDLLSKYLGETEQNICRAFAEAEAEHSILFLDEIDGLLQSRTNAGRSWEVTQVNELLCRMENFKGILIGATNFVQNLDQAVMRRFTFKIEFGFLDDAGKKLFFERMFRSALSKEEEARLSAIPSLAPGDFRTVRQSLFYYGDNVTNAMRLDALEQEAEAKDKCFFRKHDRIGF